MDGYRLRGARGCGPMAPSPPFRPLTAFPMKLGISAKLFIAILAACAAVLTVNGVASRISFQRDFMGYLNDQGMERMREVLPAIQAAYQEHGSWDFVRDRPEAWFALMRPRPRTPHAEPPISDQTGAVPRLALLDLQGRIVIGNRSAGSDAIRLPVLSDGQTVGWLVMVPFQRVIEAGDVRFYQAQLRSRWLNGLVSVTLAAALAWLVSRAMLRRVRDVTGTIHRLAAGDYGHRLQTGNDELGRLALDVNRLAVALEDTEKNRRSFMADISHELRTPLAVLRAELEAIQDGIRPLNQATLAPLQEEVRHLGKLVDDLHDLAMTQSGTLSYRLEAMPLQPVLEHAVASLRTRFDSAGLALEYQPPPGHAVIQGDERRMQQLFTNLLENSLRYTHAGGTVVVRAEPVDAQLRITIDDSAPGVPEAQIERLFERFYRVEGSRNRSSGGSGLGLAICRNIVEAHGGSVHATASALGGLRIEILLPRWTA